MFFIDRIVKLLITDNFEINVRNKVINNLLYITNCHNKGAAFSLFSGNVIFLIFITFIILFLIYRNVTKKDISKIEVISYGILLGGILGNLFDRLFYGYVIDYIDFIIFNFDFAIFNIADICIVVGALLLIFFEGSDKIGREDISRS